MNEDSGKPVIVKLHSDPEEYIEAETAFLLLEDDKHRKLRELWKDIREKIVDLLPTRNVIAHQPVRRLVTSDDKKVEYSIHMEPYQRFLNKQVKGMKGKDALTTDDLIDHGEAVEELMLELVSFSKMVIRTFTRPNLED